MSQARQEEEELQRVLELSKLEVRSSGTSENDMDLRGPSRKPSPPPASAQTGTPYQQIPSDDIANSDQSASPMRQSTPAVTTSSESRRRNHIPGAPLENQETSLQIHRHPTQVKALYSFQPLEAGELSFEAGQIITILEATDPHWYFGRISTRTGVFPKNYVEAVPRLTDEQSFEDLREEQKLFAKSGDVHRLVDMLRNAAPGATLEDNDIQVRSICPLTC